MNEGGFLGFDTSEVDIEAMRFVVFSPAYQNVFVPFIRGMENGMTQQLVDPSTDRKWAKNDDYLRGGIIVLRALLAMPEQLLAEAEQMEMEQRRTQRVQDEYTLRATEGRIGPMGFDYSNTKSPNLRRVGADPEESDIDTNTFE